MPVLSKAGANLRHAARAATLALNFGVGHRGVPGLQATAPGVCALRSACRTPAVGRGQIAALRRIASFLCPVGAPGFLAGGGFVFQHFLERCLLRTTGNGKTLIPGYPWFGDWRGDTLIALRGLRLATGRFEDATDIPR
jgi:hypothetical protein